MKNGTGVGIGEALGFGMDTLGGVTWVRSSWGRRIGRSIERCCVLVCGSVVQCDRVQDSPRNKSSE